MGGIFLQPLLDQQWKILKQKYELQLPFSNKNNALHQVSSFYC